MLTDEECDVLLELNENDRPKTRDDKKESIREDLLKKEIITRDNPLTLNNGIETYQYHFTKKDYKLLKKLNMINISETDYEYLIFIRDQRLDKTIEDFVGIEELIEYVNNGYVDLRESRYTTDGLMYGRYAITYDLSSAIEEFEKREVFTKI